MCNSKQLPGKKRRDDDDVVELCVPKKIITKDVVAEKKLALKSRNKKSFLTIVIHDILSTYVFTAPAVCKFLFKKRVIIVV